MTIRIEIKEEDIKTPIDAERLARALLDVIKYNENVTAAQVFVEQLLLDWERRITMHEAKKKQIAKKKPFERIHHTSLRTRLYLWE